MTGQRRPAAVLLAASAGSVVVALPVGLVGASAVLIRADLGFDESGIGAAFGVFFVVSGVASGFGGGLAERIGAGRLMRIACLLSAAMMLAIAAGVTSLTALLVMAALAGIPSGVGAPASSLALARGGPGLGALAFGIKQSSIPVSSLIAGASVPLIGVVFGWRAAFVVGAVLAVVVAAVMPPLAPPTGVVGTLRRREGDTPLGPLIALSAAAGLASGAAGALTAFLVETAVAVGMPVAVAGWLMVAGGLGCVASRIVLGWRAQARPGRTLVTLATVMAIGSVGYHLMAGPTPMLVTVGALIAFVFGWGWPGLYHYAVIRLNPVAPGMAAGIGQVGVHIGAAIGPVVFGLVLVNSSYTVAWRGVGVALILSAAGMLAARRWIVVERQRRAPA